MKEQHRLFARFAISHVVILTIVLAVTLLAYQRTLAVSQRKVYERIELELDSRVALMESRMEEVKSKANALSFNRSFSSLLRLEHDYPLNQIALIKDAFRSFSALNLTDSFVREYFVYFSGPQLLISTRRIALDPELYYEGFLSYEGVEFSEWVSRLFVTERLIRVWPAADIRYDPDADMTVRALTVLQPVPAERSSRYTAVVFALIDERTLLDYLDIPAFAGFAGWSAIYAADGTLLAASGIDPDRASIVFHEAAFFGPDAEVSIGEEHIARIESQRTGWTYMTSVPPHYLGLETKMIRDLLLVSELAILIIGLAVAFIMARRQSKPFATIIRSLRLITPQNSGHGNFIRNLASQLTGVIDDHRALETEMVRIRPYLRRTLLDRLISGRFGNEESLRETMEQAGVTFDGDSYQIYLFALENTEHESGADRNAHVMVSSLIGKTLAEIWKDDGLVIEIDASRLALLVRMSGSAPSKMEAMFGALDTADQIVVRMKGVSLACGESRRFQKLLDASFYYDELSRVMEYNQFGNKARFVRSAELESLQDYCLYPLNQEQRLINLAKNGEFEESAELVRTIIEHNCHTLKLSIKGIRELKGEMIGTIHRVLRSREGMGLTVSVGMLEGPLSACEESASEAAFTTAMVEVFRTLCRDVNEARQDAPARLISQSKALIDEEFMDPQLCLQSVADDLSVSPKYLSRSFSRCEGSTFSEYLELIRMEQALRLLKESAEGAAGIAHRVGYTNTNTFFKAFKRRFGITPTEWRFQNAGDTRTSGSGAWFQLR